MNLKFGPSNEDKALGDYTKLYTLVEKSEGIAIDKLFPDSDDPTTRLCAARLKRIEKKREKYLDSCKASYVARIRRYVGRSGNAVLARQLAGDITDTILFLTRTTQRRMEHKLLSPLAFTSNLNTIPELEAAASFEDTWVINFAQLFDPLCYSSSSSKFAEITAIFSTIGSLLAELGLFSQGFFQWWHDHHLDKNSRETNVWHDMRALARKMVFVLDYCASEENKDQSNIESLKKCAAEGQRIALKVVDLIIDYRSKIEEIRHSVECLIPIVYILSACSGNRISRQSEALGVIGPILDNLESFIADLDGKFAASQQADPPDESFCVCESGDRYTVAQEIRSTSSSCDYDPNSFDVQESSKKVDDDILEMAGNVIPKQRQQRISSFSVQELKRLQLDKIELESVHSGVLGSGSSALVRKYDTRDHTRQYAVKIYKLHDDEKFDENRHWNRIIREAEFWSKVDHTNINKLTGYCTFNDSIYPGLVMELCDDNLIDYCGAKSLKIEDKLTLVYDVVSGLAYLHEERCAHGDLRPENILIKKAHVPDRHIAVLADFGFADTEEGPFNRISMRTDGQRVPEAYRAPEFYLDRRDGPVMVTMKADVYAYGCVFAVIICGSVLYADARESMRKLKETGRYPVPPETISDAAYWNLLSQLWNAKPEKRPTASAVRDAVAELVVDKRLSRISLSS